MWLRGSSRRRFMWYFHLWSCWAHDKKGDGGLSQNFLGEWKGSLWDQVLEGTVV